MGQLLHWTNLLYVVSTGVPHMSVSLFSRPYSSVSAPRCALGLSLCRPSETTYCLFESFKYNHAEAQLEAERADAAAIKALLQAEPDVLDLNWAAEARLDAERADAA